MILRNFNFYLLLLCAAVCGSSSASTVRSRAPKRTVAVPKPVEDLQSRSRYALNVNYQVIRGRAQSSLAGTITENYQMVWTVLVRDQRIFIESSYGVVEAHWDAEGVNSKLGRMTLTRSDLIKLIGLEQELPQEVLIGQTEMPVLVPVLDRNSRGLDQVLRHADDNGMLIVRLAARI